MHFESSVERLYMCMLKNRLVICGNGFDAHHRLKTKYSDYRDFLDANYRDIKRSYENFPALADIGKGLWHNIEESLEIDYASYFDDAVTNDYPDIMNDESDSRWDNMWINMEVELEFIKSFTGKCFYDFLSALSFDEISKTSIVKRFITQRTKFVTFNYTETLEKIYGVTTDRVLHIHGSLNNLPYNCDDSEVIRKEIQFGAVEINATDVEREIEGKYEYDDFYGVTIRPTLTQLVGFIEKSTKSLHGNVPKLLQFVSDAKIDEVVVMGHSLLCADELYYREVLIPKFKNKKWIFMNYKKDPDCIDEIERFIKKYNLKRTKIIDW